MRLSPTLNSLPRLYTLLLLLALQPAWASEPAATVPENPAPAASADSAPDGASTAQFQFHVMAGELAAGRQQPEVAATEFLSALEYVDDAELAQRATALAAAARDEALALRAAQRWLEIEPRSGDAREVIARIALRQGHLAEVETQSLELIKGHAGGLADGFRQVALILGQTDDRHEEAALVVMKRLVTRWPDLAGAHQALGALALRYGQLPLAEQAGQRALELAPGDRDYALLLVGVYVRQQRVTEADALVARLLRKDKKPAELRMGYAKLLLESQQRDAARAQLQQIIDQQPDYADARYALGVLAFNDKDFEAASRHFTPLLKGARAQEAAFELGRIAEAQAQYALALDYYSRVSRGPQALDAAVRRANVLALQDQVPEAQALMRNLRRQLPQLAQRFYLAEGQMLVDNGRLDQALALYGEGLNDFPDDADLIYGRSLVHERQKRVDLAEQDLRSLIALDPEDARALNALGYMLTVHTSRLDEAHELIGRALALEPEDPAIIDSMGWVQYKRGKPEDALTLLRAAFERFPDAEVAAHLGEVLWSLGNRDEARSIWNAALRESPEHQVLQETIQRFAQ